MFGYFKFKNRNHSPAPTWLKWGVIIFLLVILLANSRSFNGEPNNIQLAFSNIRSHIPSTQDYAEYIPNLQRPQIVIEGEAQGLPALCGQIMEVAHAGFLGEKPVVKGLVSVPVLPEDDQPKLRQLLADLQPGQVKHLVFAQAEPINRWIEVESNQSVTSFHLTIDRMHPDMPDITQKDAISIKLFDEKTGEGEAAACGDEARVSYNAYDGSGALVAQGSRQFVIGKGEVMIGLEQGVIGMQPGGQRILLLSPAWQAPGQQASSTKDANKPLTALPNNQMMTLQVIREPVPTSTQ